MKDRGGRKPTKKAIADRAATPGMVKALKRIPIFSGLSESEAQTLLKSCNTAEYAKGRTIFSENMPGNEVYLIVKGCIAVTTSGSGDMTKVLAVLKEGDFLGEMAVVDTETRGATAIVYEDVKLIVVTSKEFLDFVSQNSQVTMKIIKALCTRLREANEEIRSFSFHGQAGRLAKTIMTLSDKFGKEQDGQRVIDIHLTHQDIGDMMGIARETVTKLLGAMKQDGSIDVRNKKVVVADRKRLAGWIT